MSTMPMTIVPWMPKHQRSVARKNRTNMPGTELRPASGRPKMTLISMARLTVVALMQS